MRKDISACVALTCFWAMLCSIALSIGVVNAAYVIVIGIIGVAASVNAVKPD